jgi:hypothetical protein
MRGGLDDHVDQLIHLFQLALLTWNVLLLKDLERDGREPTLAISLPL